MEQVESLHACNEAAFEEGLADREVHHEIIRIEDLAAVATAAVDVGIR